MRTIIEVPEEQTAEARGRSGSFRPRVLEVANELQPFVMLRVYSQRRGPRPPIFLALELATARALAAALLECAAEPDKEQA